MRPTPMRHASALLVSAAVMALALAPLGAHAGARMLVYDPDVESMPPIIVPPTPPALPGEPPRATARGVRERLRVMDREISECVLTHLDETPRTLTVHVFVYPSGEWGIGFGRVRRASEAGARGDSPVEVCIADWVSSTLGTHTEPFRGRRPRDVVHTYRLR